MRPSRCVAHPSLRRLLILLACTTLAAACSTAHNAGPVTTDGFVTGDDGVRLFYRTVGDGPQRVVLPADLFLHPAFDRLAAGRTLIYYDMRNRGRSDSVTAQQANSIRQDVADLEAVRRHFRIDQCDLVGFSYLGLMVAMYAVEHPERVRRLVQLGPVPMRFGTEYPEGLRAGDASAAMDSAALAALREMQAAGLPSSDPASYCEREWAVTRFTLVGDPANVERLPPAPCAMPNEWPIRLAAHFGRHFESVQQLDMGKADFERIEVPVLTIHGTLDRNADYGAGREWAMTVREGRLLTVHGGAHCAWADAPELVFGAIDTFLAGTWPQGVERVTQLEPAPE